MDSQINQKHDPYGALRFREFRLFVVARLVLTIAFTMQAVIVGWLIYDHTKDTLSLGLIGLAEAIPAIGIALFGGHAADRMNRRKLILLSLTVLFAGSVFLSLFTLDEIHSMKMYGTLPVYAVIFIVGLSRGFFSPASSAFLAQLIPRQQYGNSAAWSSTVWQLGAVIGPALGGLMYGFFGSCISSLAVSVLILAGIVCYLIIKSKPVPQTKEGETLFQSLSSGIRFVFSNKIMITAITLDLFAVLFGGAVALLPAFADQVLHAGPQVLGYLRAAPALGAVSMAIFLAYYPPFKNAGIKLLLCVAAFGVCMILFAISKNFYFSFVLLALSGMFDNVSVVIRSTIMQIMTPEEMRGRVSAVNSIFIGSSNEIGAFESGVAARLIGLTCSVIFGGGMTLLVVAMAYKLAPSLKKFDLK